MDMDSLIHVEEVSVPLFFGFNNHPTVSVVIPCLNEAKNLPYVLPKVPKWVDEIIIVDGRSTDDSVAVAKKLCPDAIIVMEPRKGKGVALRAGFERATGDIIVMLDADGSTDPCEIPVYVGALLSGCDFAKGSRFIQGGGTSDMEPHRRLGNFGLTMLVRVLFGCGYSDLCYGYNAFWSRILPKLALDGDGFEIETMMNLRVLRNRFKVMEVPSFESSRIHGTSNLNALRDGTRVLKTILKERFYSNKPATAPAPTKQPSVAPAITD